MSAHRSDTPAAGWHPAWPIVLASLWMASAGNVALWRALRLVSPLDGVAGWGFFAAFGLAIAALLTAIVAPLAWRATLKPVLTVLLLVTAAGSHFMLAYGVVIDPSMMVNVVQTDPRESADLFGGGLALSVAGLGLLPAWAVWRWPLRQARWPRQWLHNLGLGAAAIAVALLAVLAAFQPLASTMRNHKALRYLINPLNTIYAIGSVAAEPLRPAARQFRTLGEDAALGASYAGHARPLLLVLVVGETARSDHFGLNGYARDTTPELAREGVLSLRQARSCGTSTAASLPCMFSHLGRDGYAGRDANHENLLDVLQRAGLAVLWLDNQAGCKGVCDRVPHAAVDAARHPALCPDGECLDMALLDGLDQRLAGLGEPARSKGVVLVLHQMGSHGPAYGKRSPAPFKRFGPECAGASLQQCSRDQVVNAYDHSIAYTDHVLASTVRWLKARSARYDAAMLYVSDHGESLGEGNLYLHGLPYAVAPDVQKHVPWIQWLSDGAARRREIDPSCLPSLRDRAVDHDHLFHTVLGLMDVRTTAYRGALDANAACRSGMSPA